MQYYFHLENPFDALIGTYLETKVGTSPSFLRAGLSYHLKANMLALASSQQMAEAGIGNKENKTNNTTIRSDKIYWLDRSHDDVYERAFFEMMDEFTLYLNQTCYTGITDCEFHYALYEPGSFYKRHLDQFKNDSGRAFSVIFYLNEAWIAADGGQLRIYHEGASQDIDPLFGNMVFFKSNELEHEVLETNRPRLSITGWLKTGSSL